AQGANGGWHLELSPGRDRRSGRPCGLHETYPPVTSRPSSSLSAAGLDGAGGSQPRGSVGLKSVLRGQGSTPAASSRRGPKVTNGAVEALPARSPTPARLT